MNSLSRWATAPLFKSIQEITRWEGGIFTLILMLLAYFLLNHLFGSAKVTWISLFAIFTIYVSLLLPSEDSLHKREGQGPSAQ